MSMDEHCMTYCDHFFDDSINVVNGFDCITNHIQKTFSYVTTIQNLFEHKISAEEELVKSYSKIVKSLSKNEHINDPILKLLVNTLNTESEKRSKFCESVKSGFIEDLKTVSKKQIELLRKIKNDIGFDIKNRKNHFELATKACKNVNSKIKTHDQTFKKTVGTEMDEKTKIKFHKSQEAIRQAGIEVKVCAESLEMTLQKYIKNYKDFCCKVEKTDLMMIDLIRTGVMETSLANSNFYTEAKECYDSLTTLPEDTTGVEYCRRFVASEAKKSSFPAYTFISENEDSGRKEYSLELSVEFDDKATKNIIDPSELTLSNQTSSRTNMKRSGTVSSETPVEQPASAPPPAPQAPQSASQKVEAPVETKPPKIGDTVTAIYDFDGENDDELSFKIGDKIKIVSQEDDVWYLGELANGKKGAFPLSYVE